MQYCPHCLTPNVTGLRCPKCGGDLSVTGKKGMVLPVGLTLSSGNGRRTYWIGAARGRGGFGVTYGAIELHTQRRVAVKEYFPTLCSRRGTSGVTVHPMKGYEAIFQGGMKSFLREAQMLVALKDLPSVVRVLDFFQANGTAYLVMEFLDGMPLHKYMAKCGGTIPAPELLRKLEPVIRDLAYLHQRGVLHRDISPDNLMWMPNGTIKLLDFGSARSMENGKSMTVLLKEGFSPVEQYRSKGQGPYTDVYSMAATIYFCTTGKIPPGAIERLENDNIRSPILLGANLTVEQETAILWGLSIQPKARPQTMKQFYKALYRQAPRQRMTRWVARYHETVPARMDQSRPPVQPPPPHNNTDLSLGVRVLIGILAAIILIAFFFS